MIIACYGNMKFRKMDVNYKKLDKKYKKAREKVNSYLGDLIYYIDNESNREDYYQINKKLKSSLLSIRKLWKYCMKYDSLPGYRILERMYPNRDTIQKVCENMSHNIDFFRSSFKNDETAKMLEIERFKLAYWRGLYTKRTFGSSETPKFWRRG